MGKRKVSTMEEEMDVEDDGEGMKRQNEYNVLKEKDKKDEIKPKECKTEKLAIPTLLPKKKIDSRIEEHSLEKEDHPFFGKKLKKTKPVKRAWDDQELEQVELKSHAFEHNPEKEEVECKSSVNPSTALNIKYDETIKVKKKKKKTSLLRKPMD